MADMTRDQLVFRARQMLGATDPTKGGPTDAELYPVLDNAIKKFCVEAGALRSVFKLSTKANDKYLPFIDEILWPIAVSFLDVDGLAYPLRVTDIAPRPGSIGPRPSVWWLTAVNVPDVNGRSTPTMGIDPAVSYNGAGNVLLEAFQLPQDVQGAAGNVPELVSALHPYLATCLALEAVEMFPEKADFIGKWERDRARGMDVFRKLSKPTAKAPFTGKDVKGYRVRSRSRF